MEEAALPSVVFGPVCILLGNPFVLTIAGEVRKTGWAGVVFGAKYVLGIWLEILFGGVTAYCSLVGRDGTSERGQGQLVVRPNPKPQAGNCCVASSSRPFTSRQNLENEGKVRAAFKSKRAAKAGWSRVSE